MIVAMLFVLCAAATWTGLCFVAFDAIAYGSLRRAVRRGVLDATPSDQMRPVRMNALGQNPDITYRYAVYELGPGQAARVRGKIDPDAIYFSIAIYDSLFQSILPERSRGPTLLTERELTPDDGGTFTLVVAPRDPGTRPWLDVSAAPRGILFERHIGGAPPVVSRIEVFELSQEEA